MELVKTRSFTVEGAPNPMTGVHIIGNIEASPALRENTVQRLE